MQRTLVSSFKSLALITAALVVAAAVSTAARQTPEGVTGTWKLNDAASNNPNGPAPVAGGDRRGGGGGATGGGRGGGNFDATGGAAGRPNQAPSELSAEERARIKVMLDISNHAASVLEIILEGGEITIKQDGTGFPKQTADGKKSVLKNPKVGEVNIKVKIDAKGMTREITTQEDLKIVETYTPSADGKQLTVTVKESHPVQKIEDMKIKRVYERQ